MIRHIAIAAISALAALSATPAFSSEATRAIAEACKLPEHASHPVCVARAKKAAAASAKREARDRAALESILSSTPR